ncbi:nitroreductase family deazaflavin-dependent oxidoreductase [Mycobacterium colombiense]|uniref:nitroreductase family deazaflavin-dependent oxidoreductase n=1 Tax=Mycobacterium colombiense TaxID=339268 RepID=UPI00200A4FCF|nr:nitroreductase family deazaflavin-dependent oxidoreductase [Mycobacterium colombiense]MCK8642394.1 nitroreductase family deazaflavin-dependent oxidoreductase [Mycobacterium colombiense]
MVTAKKRPGAIDSPLFVPISRYIGRVHTWLYRCTGGRFGGKLRLGAAFRNPAPTLLLEHRGRKSGKKFTTPLLYIADKHNIVVVASALGHASDPQWYRNLMSCPDTHIQIGSIRRPVRAVVANSDERARLWPRLVNAYADFDSYQSWTEREIPVVVLEPR